MLKDGFYFGSLLSFATLCLSCGSNPPPNTELCLVGDSGVLCIDRRLPEGQQEYVVSFPNAVNMVCLSPDSYGALLEWAMTKGKRARYASREINSRISELYKAVDRQ